jgi:hypothetical protein
VDVNDDFEHRLRAVEASQIVDGARLNELESWRRRDEPRTLSLVHAADVADEVRKALNERSQHEWSIGQKLAAAMIAAPTFIAGVLALVEQARHLHL